MFKLEDSSSKAGVRFGIFGSDGHVKIWSRSHAAVTQEGTWQAASSDAAVTHEATWQVAAPSSQCVNACVAKAGLVAVGLGILEEGQTIEEPVHLWSIQ